MWNIFRFRETTKKNVSVFLCILFIVFCLFLVLLGFLWGPTWAELYTLEFSDGAENSEKTEPTTKTGLIIVYFFALSLLVTCILMLLALKQNSHREILWCFLALLVLWQAHLIICFISLVIYAMEYRADKTKWSPLLKSLPVLVVQAIWLIFVSIVWYYWKELSLFKDVPAYLFFLRMNDVRNRALRQDQKERLGELPKRLLSQMIPQARGIALADAR